MRMPYVLPNAFALRIDDCNFARKLLRRSENPVPINAIILSTPLLFSTSYIFIIEINVMCCVGRVEIQTDGVLPIRIPSDSIV